MTDSAEAGLRESLLRAARSASELRLNVGTAGNLSVRCGADLLITPSGRDPRDTAASELVRLALDGRVIGAGKPSSEWRFHCALYRQRPEVGAVVHMHSPFATTLSCRRQGLPPFHYGIARFGGEDVRCAAYAPFATAELAQTLLDAMHERSACLMANHGATVIGRDPGQALANAIELEFLCELYWRALQGGAPVLIDAAEMREVGARYRTYCSGM